MLGCITFLSLLWLHLVIFFHRQFRIQIQGGAQKYHIKVVMLFFSHRFSFKRTNLGLCNVLFTNGFFWLIEQKILLTNRKKSNLFLKIHIFWNFRFEIFQQLSYQYYIFVNLTKIERIDGKMFYRTCSTLGETWLKHED